MILTRCSSVDASFRLIEEKAYVQEHKYCFLSNWTLYDHNGYIISDSTYRRGTRELAAYKGDQTPAAQYIDLRAGNLNLKKTDKKRIWIGPMHGQFGHFLLNILARAWPVVNGSPEDYIFCYCGARPEALMQIGFVRDIFKGIGITIENLEFIPESTIIESMFVAEPAFIENWSANTVLSHIAEHITRGLNININDIQVCQDPVYVSKQNVKSGVRTIGNEHDIVNFLQSKNVKIAYPDAMSFRDQIIFWNSYKTYFGFSSSAFHMTAFSSKKKLSTLTWSDKAESNQVLIDAVTGNEHLYLHSREHIRSTGRNEHFHDVVEVVDPVRVAADFLHHVTEHGEHKFGQLIQPIRSNDVLRNNYLMPFGRRLDADCSIVGPKIDDSDRLAISSIEDQSRRQIDIKLSETSYIYQIRFMTPETLGDQGIDIARITIGVSENFGTWQHLAPSALTYHRVAHEYVINVGLSRPWRFIRLDFPATEQAEWNSIQVYGQPFT